MSAPHGQGPPRSSTADVMTSIVSTYATVHDPTRFDIGEKYLKEEGAPPRIVMVRGAGKVTPGLKLTDINVGAFAQTFTAYLWGTEDRDDLLRYAASESMLDNFVNTIRSLIPGRVEITTSDPSVVSDIETFGEELQVHVTWTRQIPRIPAIWNAAQSPQNSPPDPMKPNGDTGYTFTVEASAEGATR